MGLDVLYELGVEAVAGEGLGVADDNEFHAGACDGHIHSAQVVEEADGALVIVPHHADDDDVALLPLEAIDGVDGDVAAEGAEEFLPLEKTANEAHLGEMMPKSTRSSCMRVRPIISM